MNGQGWVTGGHLCGMRSSTLTRWGSGIPALLATMLTGAFAQVEPMGTKPPGGTGKPLTVEIWSDVVCPFCYIGKREFQNALADFPHRDSVVVVWKSFELDPSAPAKREVDTYGMLVEKYGMTREEAVERTRGVRERAASLGLHYDFDKSVIGSSFDAHRLIQLAKTKGLGDSAEERLFKAYFTEGRHLADPATLKQLDRTSACLPRRWRRCSRAMRSPGRCAPMSRRRENSG